MEKRLKDKVAIVTGAGKIGAECAAVMAARGAKVVVVDLIEAAAVKAADAIKANGDEATAMAVDVTSEDQVRDLVARTIKLYGRIDILHNNAALTGAAHRDQDRDVCNTVADAWDRAMAVNVKGPFLMCKHIVPHMIKQGGGSIIHSASGLGVQAELTMSAYQASKAALIMLSKTVATQYGKQGVRSNAIAIGSVTGDNQLAMPEELRQMLLDAHLTPHFGSPRHIADVVVFLASDESAYVTGHTLAADGGFSAHTPTVAPMRAYFAKLGASKF